MQNKASKDKARQLKKKTGSASKEKGQEDDENIEDELYDDDPEFEEIANNNGVKGSKLSDGDGAENEEGYDYMDDSLNLSQKSPKQTLIDHLRLLADIFNSSTGEGASDYYDQLFDERAQFLLDFDNILKVLTFDETVEYILPCMQVYSCEQDYLKLKLFQSFEKLFKKLFKAAVFIPQ